MNNCISTGFRFPWHISVRQLSLLTTVACLLSLAGCGESDDGGETNIPVDYPTPAPQTVAPESSEKGGLSAKIKFKKENGDTAFSIKPQDDGAKLVDADEQELARFNLSGSKLKVKDPDDTVLGYVIASAGRYKIEDANQEVELWKLQQQEDGDWKLEDGQDQLIYKIKKREYGFEIEDATDNSLFKAKLKEGKTSLRNASEQTVYSTKDQVPTIAVTCLGFEKIDSLPLRTALMTMLIFDDGR